MRLSRGASLDERRQCFDHVHSTNPTGDNVNNSNDRYILSDNLNLDKKKLHPDRHEKSKSDRHSYYEERENGVQMKASDKSELHAKRGELFDDGSNVDRSSYYNENDPHSKPNKVYSDNEKAENAERRSFYSDNDLQVENRIRRDNAKSKFFENELAECANEQIYPDTNIDDHPDSMGFYEKNDPLVKLENESKIQMRRAHFSECENRKSFGDVDLRRSKGSLRQEHRGRSAFSESVDSASSRSQISSLEAATDFADKMMKSSRSYLAESAECCRLNTSSSAREASDDSSPGAVTQGFETLDSKYARKRARKCGHRRQKSLDISRHSTQADLTQNDKSFRDFELEEDLSKRLDRLEPKSAGYNRQSIKKNLSRYDLNFDSEDERCFRHSLDMERSFDLDFLDTSIDDRYGSFDRDYDLV